VNVRIDYIKLAINEAFGCECTVKNYMNYYFFEFGNNVIQLTEWTTTAGIVDMFTMNSASRKYPPGGGFNINNSDYSDHEGFKASLRRLVQKW